MHPIETRLAELGVTLPDAPAPAANYVPFVQVGNLVHISGQISQNEAGLIKGKLGEDLSFEQGAEAARRSITRARMRSADQVRLKWRAQKSKTAGCSQRRGLRREGGQWPVSGVRMAEVSAGMGGTIRIYARVCRYSF